MAPPVASQQQPGQQEQAPPPTERQSVDVKMLATKAVIAYSEFLTSVIATATPTSDAKNKSKESVGNGVAKFEAAMNDLREGVKSKRRKVDPLSHQAVQSGAAAAAQVTRGSESDQIISREKPPAKELSEALAAISAVVEKLGD